MPPFIDLTGKRFGRLIVIQQAERSKTSQIQWLCKCDCGNNRIYTTSSLNLRTKSCGCLHAEHIKHPPQHKTHGLYKSPEHGVWLNMLSRCYNKKVACYPRYGGRGISVCRQWRQFSSFYSDMGPRPSSKHTLERKDNAGNYEPDNCKWATLHEQSVNRRSTVFIEYHGKTLCLKDWAKILGIGHKTLHFRIRVKHWDIDRAFSTPVSFSQIVRSSGLASASTASSASRS